MSYHSRKFITSSGGDTFTFSFPFLDYDHVKAYVEGTPVSFTWDNSYTIKTDTPVASGDTLEIRRETPRDQLVDYSGGSKLQAAALNEDSKQALYISEELEDAQSLLGDEIASNDSDISTNASDISYLEAKYYDIQNMLVGGMEAQTLISVGSMDLLKDIEPFHEMRVYLIGYYFAYRTGGGVFLYLDYLSKAYHNGGTLIDPEHSAIPGSPEWYTAENSGNGAWMRLSENNIYTPEMFGAKGNNMTDDTIAISKAIREALDNNGSMSFRPTTYRVTDQIGVYGDVTTDSTLYITSTGMAKIRFDNLTFSNYGLVIEGEHLRTVIVENVEIQGNDRVVMGISLRDWNDEADVMRVVQCKVTDCLGPNDSSVTKRPTGIVVHGARVASVESCIVEGVSRAALDPAGFTLSCTGISVLRGYQAQVSDCYVKGISRGGYGDYDADGIKVFSPKEGDVYIRSNAVVTRNSVIDCEGRWVKLQTAGQANIQNNYFAIEGAIELMTSFNGIDSQRGDTNITDNRFFMGSDWTGGSSCALVEFQPSTSASMVNDYESFFHRFVGNQAYIEKKLPYGILPQFMTDTTTAKQYIQITDNIITSDVSETSSNPAGLQAVGRFIYINSSPTGSMQGNEVWHIDRNHVYCDNFFYITSSTTRVDLADKWFIYVRDNSVPTFDTNRDLFYDGANTGVYTSTCCIARNQVGAGGDGFTWPIDMAKLIQGTDCYTGNTTMTNAPSSYTYSRLWALGGHIGVDRTTVRYISFDGSSWYKVDTIAI